MEKQSIKTPKDILIRLQIVHLGKILFNLQFVPFIVMVASVFSFILPAIYYIMLLAVSFFTVFSIYAWYPEFSSWWAGGEVFSKIATQLMQSWKYTIPIVFALAIASIVCLSFDKNKKNTVRIVCSVVIGVLAAIVLIFKLINRGGVQ